MHVVEAVVSSMTPERQAALDALLRRTDVKPRVRERGEMVKAALVGQNLARIIHGVLRAIDHNEAPPGY